LTFDQKELICYPQSAIRNPQSAIRNPLKWLINSLAISTLCLSANVWAGSATWTNVNNGTLDGVSFTVTYTNANTGETTSNQNLSGADYNYQALGASQAGIIINNNQDTTFTFASPVSNLLLYGRFWRGTACTGTGAYTFNHTPTIKSGFGSTTVSGNNLTVGTSAYGNGILSFAGPLTILTVANDCTDSSQIGLFTLATDASAPPPPPPPPPVPASLLNFNQPTVIFSKEIKVTE
jgi:hypothetical protein